MRRIPHGRVRTRCFEAPLSLAICVAYTQHMSPQGLALTGILKPDGSQA